MQGGSQCSGTEGGVQLEFVSSGVRVFERGPITLARETPPQIDRAKDR